MLFQRAVRGASVRRRDELGARGLHHQEPHHMLYTPKMYALVRMCPLTYLWGSIIVCPGSNFKSI